MKKCMVLKSDLPTPEAKKLARELKKAHETLWGKGTCSVVVMKHGSDLETLAETYDEPSLSSGCGRIGCDRPCGKEQADDDQPAEETD